MIRDIYIHIVWNKSLSIIGVVFNFYHGEMVIFLMLRDI